MVPCMEDRWPVFVGDRRGRTIYLTWERWEHALGHPGMDSDRLDAVLDTLRTGRRQQDKYDSSKHLYSQEVLDLPEPYTHVVVITKTDFRGNPPVPNGFVLTAYLIQKW